jgi:hypothetical protein
LFEDRLPACLPACLPAHFQKQNGCTRACYSQIL